MEVKGVIKKDSIPVNNGPEAQIDTSNQNIEKPSQGELVRLIQTFQLLNPERPFDDSDKAYQNKDIESE